MIYVGKFSEAQLIKGEDKKEIEKTQKKTGLKYIKSKIVKEKGVKYMKVWLVPTYDLTLE